MSPSPQDVAQAQLDRVEADLRGELVEQRLDGEGGGRCSGRSIGPETDAIGEHAVGAQRVRAPTVGTGGQQGGEALGPPLVVAPAIQDDAPRDRGELALGARPDLELEQLGRGGVGGRHVLGARERDTDRPAEAERRRRRERLGNHELAAEGAAERRRAHAHAVQREAEELRELLAHAERALSARPYDEVALGLEPRGGGLRLEVALVDPARAEGARGARRAGGQRALRVARGDPLAPGHVVGEILLRGGVLAAGRAVRAPGVLAVALDTLRAGEIGAPGAIAASRSMTAGSGSAATITRSAPSVAAASDSATTSATGWPE